MASDTGGEKSFSLQGRLYRERERLIGMTCEEREWRAQWVRDQHLCDSEPTTNPDLYKELNNPIRRLYRFPLDTLARVLTPVMGKQNALVVRVYTGKILMGLTFFYSVVYYIKYNCNDWTRKGGWRVLVNRPSVIPGEPEFPAKPKRTSPADYNDRGFKKSPI